MGRPGLLGAIARTAVVAGTATATANAVNRRSARHQQQQAEAAAYEQQVAAPPPPAAPAPPEDDHRDLVRQLTELAALHTDGALSDDEFEAAKRQLLG